jgi:hypothetical protein
MKATDFDKKFDLGEDVTGLLDLSKAKRTGLETKRINVDFPEWMIESMDQEAQRIGTTSQSLIKFWVADRLENRANNQ